MSLMFQTLLKRHIPQNEWTRTPYAHPDGKWIYVNMKSRLEVREALYPDDFDEGYTMQHLELHSKIAPVRWPQWEQVFQLWVGDALAAKGKGSCSWHPLYDVNGKLLFWIFNAWYSYPTTVIQAYLETREQKVRA